jgi:recombination protein RecT
MVCAELGLEPSNFLGQAYLVPFSNKGVLEAQLIPGYRGYIALARRSGEVQTVSAQVVYEKDHFVLQYGLEDKLEHVPYQPTDEEIENQTHPRGRVKGAYVVFRYKDNSYSFDYMSKADIDAIRKRSKAANNGPWVTDYGEMAKKTVIKRHAKLAPLSVEFQKASILEDLAHAGESQMSILDPDTIDANHTTVNPLEDKIAAAGTPQTSPDAQESTNSEKGYPCPVEDCTFVAVSERGLKKHITQSHPESVKAPEPEPEPEPLVKDDEPEPEPKDKNPGWNGLWRGCPDMGASPGEQDGNPIPVARCVNCKKREGCPNPWPIPEGDAPF